MSLNYVEIMKRTGCRLVGFRKSSQDSTSTIVTDDDGNNVNYNCSALEIQNLSASKTLEYSFDNSNFQKVKPLVTEAIEMPFNFLYVKSSSGTVDFQGRLLKNQ